MKKGKVLIKIRESQMVEREKLKALYKDIFKLNGMLKGELNKYYLIDLKVDYREILIGSSLYVKKGDVIIIIKKKAEIIKRKEELYIRPVLIVNKEGRETEFKTMMIKLMTKYKFLKTNSKFVK